MTLTRKCLPPPPPFKREGEDLVGREEKSELACLLACLIRGDGTTGEKKERERGAKVGEGRVEEGSGPAKKEECTEYCHVIGGY